MRTATLVPSPAAVMLTVLVGRCYDLLEAPPYGPWAKALARVLYDEALPPGPDLTASAGAVGGDDASATCGANAPGGATFSDQGGGRDGVAAGTTAAPGTGSIPARWRAVVSRWAHPAATTPRSSLQHTDKGVRARSVRRTITPIVSTGYLPEEIR